MDVITYLCHDLRLIILVKSVPIFNKSTQIWKYSHALCFLSIVMVRFRSVLPKYFSVTSLTLGQSFHFSDSFESILTLSFSVINYFLTGTPFTYMNELNYSSLDKWLIWVIKCGIEITYPSPNFNGATIEVWERISNFIPHHMMVIITYPCWYQSKTM